MCASMDNPQHYQPLSYALHPPNTSTTPKPGATTASQELAEEEDENLVAEQLNSKELSGSSTNKPAGYARPNRRDRGLIPVPGRVTRRFRSTNSSKNRIPVGNDVQGVRGGPKTEKYSRLLVLLQPSRTSPYPIPLARAARPHSIRT